MMLASTLPFCYHATHVLRSLNENSNRVYNSLWYKLPVKKQHKLILLIIYAQKERNIDGFGLISCSIRTMLKVRIYAV